MNKKEKVLHVVGGMDIGGTETMLMNLYRQIHKDIRFDFISYYDRDGYYDKEIIELGGKIISTKSPAEIGQLKAIKNLYKIIKEGRYDIVHAHTLFNCGIAMIAAKLAGTKIRISHSHTNLDMGNSIIKKIYFTIMRILIILFSTNYIACSNSAGEYLFGKNIIKNNKYKVLPNYVDYTKFLNFNNNINLIKKLKLNDDDIITGHIGRFVDAKNHNFLIEVANKMINKDNRIKLILVGDGPLKEEIEKKVIKLGISDNVFFLGLRKDVDLILNSCDIFLFPSIYEGLGLVMLEAQASGLPCLVSEAIQPEADLGIGLVKQIKLDDGIDKWADEALKLIGKKNNNKEAIEEALKLKDMK
ncbi:glycosyltransferase family 1 protein [Clostridium celatum]|uniref:Glycosyltransferase, group 1 family protein n=1 Tax=Clostridium celatum DSM 1785 TaxID=545697 RepID=L1QM23_9CLOT|nr:glycosyltransferase family 1 protein [Clostridium celatum]EKY29023.1 glycosyltransferase, group 1 family protein [Clostridium celatum DSM 1785]